MTRMALAALTGARVLEGDRQGDSMKATYEQNQYVPEAQDTGQWYVRVNLSMLERLEIISGLQACQGPLDLIEPVVKLLRELEQTSGFNEFFGDHPSP